ncbi:Mpo1 family 2-hydroxy fatty acid dioxygenase [Diaphorobacter caeni]|uniref:Mpo1 family 2-hydroxy fatty acid dioxygenase n=1 Tax=Diaphorobacter caeni TaxID=2784387 RepID=UPI00188DEAE5|nr:Mpo1-like protein [Diaphorobacter caeni]MBF5005972.1 DUF962 domain-containing protein [Diaphorobacter caeni]
MRSLTDQLTQYAQYHRDPRNIQTHLVGVPMIMLAVVILLSRPVLLLGAMPLTPAFAVGLAACVFYFLLDLRYGFCMALVIAAMLVAGQWCAAQTTAFWLTSGIGLFVVGWVIQFVGHYFEGRKPAFVDDVIGLAIGPLFVLAEVGFALGLRNEVRQAVEECAGPVRRRVGGPAS